MNDPERRRIRIDTLLELVRRLNKSPVRVDEHFPDVLRLIAEMKDEGATPPSKKASS